MADSNEVKQYTHAVSLREGNINEITEMTGLSNDAIQILWSKAMENNFHVIFGKVTTTPNATEGK